MNGDSGSIGNVWFRRNRETAVGAWKRRWWNWGGRGASICRCVLTGVNTQFVCNYEEVEYEKALGQLVAVKQKLEMVEIPPATELVPAGHSCPFISCRIGLNGVKNWTLNIKSMLCGEGDTVFLSVGTMSKYTPYLALYLPQFIWTVRLGDLNTRAVVC